MNISWRNHDLSIALYDGEFNVVHFESQRDYQLWNEPIMRLVKQVKGDIDVDINVCSEDGKELKPSQILYVSATNQDALEQRALLKLIHGRISDVIEHNPILFEKYEEIHAQLVHLFSSTYFEDTLRGFELDFDVERLSLIKLIEAIPFEVVPETGENWEVNSRKIKETIISLHIEANPNCQLLILDYPEHRMSIREKKKFIEYLKTLSQTILIVTSDYHFLKAVNHVDHLQIISDLGERYPISEVVLEQQLFYSEDAGVLEKTLAQMLGVVSFYSSEEQKAIESVLKQL